MYERSLEHLGDAASFKEGSHIVDHWISDHPDENEAPPFKFNVLQSFQHCLSRQMAEAMKIHMFY